jgi:hypothetical protein
MQLKDVKANSKPFTVKVKILDLLVRVTKKDLIVSQLGVGDATSTAVLTLIRRSNQEDLVQDTWYQLDEVQVRMVDGFIRLYADTLKYSRIECSDTVNYDVNISNQEYEYCPQ